MQRRWLLVGLIVIVALTIWRFSDRSTGERAEPAANNATPAGVAPQPQTTPRLSDQPSYEVPAGGAYTGLSDARWQWWEVMKKVDRSFEWKMPISFYGRVIDEDGRPVAGATVRFSWTDASARGSSDKIATSDADGRFSLVGETGKRLSVRVAKDGFHSSGGEGGQSFEYAAFFEDIYHRPDTSNPVTFQLIKKLDPEPIVARHLSQRTSYDEPCYFEIDRGILVQQPTAGAGLKFTFERSESPQGQPFDWTWKVEGVNSTLSAIADEFPQLAPEDGYVPSWETSQAASAPSFEQTGHARFYVRTAANTYARVEVEVAHPNARSLGPRITVNSFLNPSGSRNVDYDPDRPQSVP